MQPFITVRKRLVAKQEWPQRSYILLALVILAVGATIVSCSRGGEDEDHSFTEADAAKQAAIEAEMNASVYSLTGNEVENLAASATLSLVSNALLSEGETHVGMTGGYLTRLVEEAAKHETALTDALNVLTHNKTGTGADTATGTNTDTETDTGMDTGTAYDERVNRIGALVERLIANTHLINEGRPALLKAIITEAAELKSLRLTRVTQIVPAAIATRDNSFVNLANRDDITSQRSHEQEVLWFDHVATLPNDITRSQTFLEVMSRTNSQENLARLYEAFDSTVHRIARAVEYLKAHGGSELAPDVIGLAEQHIAIGSGNDNYFERLERRLKLVAAERDLIEENTEIHNKLLFEIESLVAEIEGKPAPEMTFTALDETDGSDDTVENGVTDKVIRFGQSAVLSGPTKALGQNMRRGIEAAFHEVNVSGGIHGRNLELTALDDSYEPDFAFANTLRLIKKEQVFGLIGAVGTPTSRAASPLAHANGVPFIAPFTGAAVLREPELRNTLNVRASYHQETEKMIERLTEDLGVTRVAVLYQNDSYGLDGLEGVHQALERRDLEPVASWYYQRNTKAVKSAVYRLAAANPEAVIIIGSYAPAAETVKLLKDRLETDPVFMAVSFVGSEALADELGDNGAGFYVTQVVPLLDDTSTQVVAKYQAALAAYDPDATAELVSLEGYLAGRLAITGVELCGPDLSRQCFLDAIYNSETIDIDGLQLQFSTGDNQGSDNVILTVLGADGNYRQVDSLKQSRR